MAKGKKMGSGKKASRPAGRKTAAKKAGVTWIVYTSILRADTSPIDLAADDIDYVERPVCVVVFRLLDAKKAPLSQRRYNACSMAWWRVTAPESSRGGGCRHP